MKGIEVILHAGSQRVHVSRAIQTGSVGGVYRNAAARPPQAGKNAPFRALAANLSCEVLGFHGNHAIAFDEPRQLYACGQFRVEDADVYHMLTVRSTEGD